jgi:hypothetical protein
MPYRLRYQKTPGAFETRSSGPSFSIPALCNLTLHPSKAGQPPNWSRLTAHRSPKLLFKKGSPTTHPSISIFAHNGASQPSPASQLHRAAKYRTPRAHSKLQLTTFSGAFEDFLKSFKSSTVEASEALEGLNLDEDSLSDEYDFMEDADAGAARTRRNQQHPKVKYMKMLQDVADRKIADILIELDDVEQVGMK